MIKYKKYKDYIILPSKNPKAKYDVYKLKNNEFIKLFDFGGIKDDGTPYDQYKDKIGYYSKYDHKDSKRRSNYIKRHFPKFKNRKTALSGTKEESPAWFSLYFLW